MTSTWHTIYRLSDGEIVRTLTARPAEIDANTPDGCAAVEGQYYAANHHVVGGQLMVYDESARTTKSARPPWADRWDNANLCWNDPRPLEQRKTDAWAAIKAERERRMAGTFDHAGHTYDIDLVNLPGASIDAREALIADEAWSQMWVLADNSVITLTAIEMIALARAAKTVVSNLWGTSQYLRGLIEAATTITEVEVITWP